MRSRRYSIRISPRSASLVLRQVSGSLQGVIRDDAAGHSAGMIVLPPIKPKIAEWIDALVPFNKASVRSHGDYRTPGHR